MTELWDPQLSLNLRNFIMFAYPWGKAGTPLEKFKEPRKWQIEEFEKVTDHIRQNLNRIRNKEDPHTYKSSTSSGRGIGKSAFVSMMNHWMMTTQLGSTAITTANTEAQLSSRTWAEMGKWHTLSINSHWFERTALSLKPAPWFAECLKDQLKIDIGYYYAQAQLWSEEKPDSFAGAHNQSGIMLCFDEASGIPKPIWTVSEGFFTEPVLHRYWFVFSNPRRNTGEFYETFHKQREIWKHQKIDSRSVEGTDKLVLNNIIKVHGEDSYEANVEVKGEFPNTSSTQFISRSLVEEARLRETFEDKYAALIMGVDPARYGDDKTVIMYRQGRDTRNVPPIIKLEKKDNMVVANVIAEQIDKYKPDAVCIDAGNGTGIIDRLREMGYLVHEVWFGSESDREEYADKRTELWGEIREWLKGGCLPENNVDLIDDLVGPNYKFVGAAEKIKLESKEEMKKRGHHSPDTADALACTFFVKVARKDNSLSRKKGMNQVKLVKGTGMSPF
jgi:hypothetical protein